MEYLFPSYRKDKFKFLKANESWISVLIVDPVVIPVVLLLRRFKNSFPFYMITPNVVSLFSFIVFFLTVILMLLYPDQQNKLGWGLMVSASLLDEIDGRLARATGAASDFGALVDTFFDMFRTSLGVALIGLALARAHHCFWIFPLMTFYCLFHGSFHMNQFTRIVMDFNKSPQPKGINDIPKTSWQRFCDRRGLVYTLFSEYEASTLIFLSIIFFRNPILPITGIIIFRFLYWPIIAMASANSVSKRLQ